MNMIQIQNEIIARFERARMTAHRQNARAWGRLKLVAMGYTDKEQNYIVEQAVDMFYLNQNAEI